MANNVTFQPTKFTDWDPVIGRERDVSWGYRIFDDYGHDYHNLMEVDEVKTLTPSKVWKIIQENHKVDFVDFIEAKGGFYFDNTYVELSELV